MTVKIHRLYLPKNPISFIDYLKLILFLFFAKLRGYQGVILDLPLEVQYPYLFYQLWKGEELISFAEKLRKLLTLELYWSNAWSPQLNKFKLSSFPISWDFIPTDINLAVDIRSLKKTSNHTGIKKIFDKIVAQKKHQIKAIINKRGEDFSSVKSPLLLSPIQEFLVFS